MAPPSQPLVEYSDSDDSDCGPPPPKLQKKTGEPKHPEAPVASLPPLPSRFHDLYAVPPRVGKEDNPALHGGRKRAIPHVQGNWPTHVFVEWHLTRAEFDTLDTLYSVAAKGASAADHTFKLESHLQSDLGSELPLHLSLSRPNVLRTEQREGFLETLSDRYHKARVKPFTVDFCGFEWVGNYDRTRWFLVLKASVVPKSELPRLLELTNRTFAVFNQPGLYGSNGDGMNGFHVSLAWSLAEPSVEVKRKVQDALLAEGGGNKILIKGKDCALKMEVGGIKVKIGNAVHVVELVAGKPTASEIETRTGKRKASVGS
ncbi:hypothetical protein K440DRAFT_552618 [Wilcoxina mikolae CBS 423.85]|nr:hypothetical protein K440DRAFT_552618 [Wilcoxina mikolae CBS 423.85]